MSQVLSYCFLPDELSTENLKFNRVIFLTFLVESIKLFSPVEDEVFDCGNRT
jgi:hypothetical protein